MLFSYYRQLDAMDCGPTCLRMVAKYYGKSVSLDFLRNQSQFGQLGVSMLGLAEAAEIIGFKNVGAKLSLDQLINDVVTSPKNGEVTILAVVLSAMD